MDRRSFIATLLGGAAGAKYFTLPAAEALPALPVPKHDPIQIVKELYVSLANTDHTGLSRELMAMGRTLSGSWVLNEEGLFQNSEEILFESKFFRGSIPVDSVILSSPSKPWMVTGGVLSNPKTLSYGDRIRFCPGHITLTPEEFSFSHTTLEEAFPDIHSWKKDLPIPCTCYYYYDYEDAGIRAPEKKAVLDDCPIHGRLVNAEYRIS